MSGDILNGHMSRQLQCIPFKGVAVRKPGIGKSELLLADFPTTPTFKPLNLIIQKHSFRSDGNHPKSPGKGSPKDNVPTPTERTPKLSPFALDGKDDRTLLRIGCEHSHSQPNQNRDTKDSWTCFPFSNWKSSTNFLLGLYVHFFQLLNVRINRMNLIKYLDKCSEDELIDEVLLPLFRQLGFHRITSAGHKDKALEYGKDIWMRYILPTQHVLYFGVQAKKGKLDAAGINKGSNTNIAEIHNQLLMMLGHEIFDPETNRQVLVDHAFIVAGGEITKQAKNWLGQKLDASKRSQILFMDRKDILNLYVVSNLPLPEGAIPKIETIYDDVPF